MQQGQNLSLEFNVQVDGSLQSWARLGVRGKQQGTITPQFLKKQMFLSNTLVILKHLLIVWLHQREGLFFVLTFAGFF